MAWTYSDYIEQTAAAAFITRLRQHIREVSDKIQADVSAHGYSRQSHPLNDYLKGLREELKSKEASGGGTAGGVSHATFTAPS